MEAPAPYGEDAVKRGPYTARIGLAAIATADIVGIVGQGGGDTVQTTCLGYGVDALAVDVADHVVSTAGGVCGGDHDGFGTCGGRRCC